MNYRQIPFDINIAKDIVSGKVDGKITTTQENDVTIYDFDFLYNTSQSDKVFSIVGKIHYNGLDEVCIWSIKGKHCIRNMLSMDLVLLVKEEKVFKPFDRIIAKSHCSRIWECDLFSHYQDGCIFCVSGHAYPISDVLPFEGNEHLVGTAIDK